MANIKIDDNYKGVAAGITDDASETVQPLRVNPATNRLLADVSISSAEISGGTINVVNSGSMPSSGSLAVNVIKSVFPAGGTTVAVSSFPAGGTTVSVSTFPAGGTTVAISSFPAGGTTVMLDQKSLRFSSGSIVNKGDTTIINPVATKRLKVYAYSLISTSSVYVTYAFKDSEALGTMMWHIPLQAQNWSISGANLSVTPPAFLFGTSPGGTLILNASAQGSAYYSVAYYDNDIL